MRLESPHGCEEALPGHWWARCGHPAPAPGLVRLVPRECLRRLHLIRVEAVALTTRRLGRPRARPHPSGRQRSDDTSGFTVFLRYGVVERPLWAVAENDAPIRKAGRAVLRVHLCLIGAAGGPSSAGRWRTVPSPSSSRTGRTTPSSHPVNSPRRANRGPATMPAAERVRVGSVTTPGATGDVYACGPCLAELDHMVRVQARDRDGRGSRAAQSATLAVPAHVPPPRALPAGGSGGRHWSPRGKRDACPVAPPVGMAR
jgi:hypothetical protein